MFQVLKTLAVTLKQRYFSLQFSDGLDSHPLVLQHAMATPISILLSQLEGIESSTVSEVSVRRMRRAVERLRSLVKNKHSRRVVKFNVWLSVAKVVALLRSHDQNIVLTDIRKRSTVCCIRGQAIEFEEAVICLLQNALRANKQSAAPVHVCLYQEKSRMRLCIRDFGKGMGWWTKNLAKLPWVSFTDGGTGIGLAYATHIIEHKLQGSITIYSNCGVGTLIECSIPLKP